MARPKKAPRRDKPDKQDKPSTSSIAVERAYDHLRQQAIGFGFRPGERINEVEIAQELDMSRAPVREALNRLVMNGLVAFEAGKGFFCRKLSLKEVSELVEIRRDLESSAARDAAARASDEDIAAVAAMWNEIVQKESDLDIEAIVTADEEFHLALARLGGNDERLKILSNINERIRFVRRINLEGRRATIIGDHLRVLDAISRRDVAEVTRLLEDHLRHSPDDLKSHIHEGIARIYADEMM